MHVAPLRSLSLALALVAIPAAAQAPRLHLPVGVARGMAAPAATAPASHSVRPADVAALRGGYTESFDDITTLPAEGWAFQNNSDPVGTTSWFQGNPTVFPSYAGDPAAYIGANFNSTSGGPSGADGVIWNWGLTPPVALENGTEMRFWTRTGEGSNFPDRLQVTLSTSGASTNVGTAAGEYGDFETVLLTINDALAVGGYPEAWTEYVVTVSGLSAPTTGRFGFLYFVDGAGPLGANSNFIGIDEVSINSTIVAGEGGPGARGLSLSAGAPNPTAGTTTLAFSLAEPAAVTLRVVDALGRVVATLADGAYAAGAHTATWNARGAAPGVYTVQLQSGAAVETQRVVVAR